jgi:predicted ABC-type sugar transport system permease subunit
MTDTTAPAAAPTLRRSAALTDVGRLRDYGIVVSFVALFVVLAMTSDAFLTKTNLLNIADQARSAWARGSASSTRCGSSSASRSSVG